VREARILALAGGQRREVGIDQRILDGIKR
jgi:hypothetical protein